jgi:hypothetical protein
LIAAMITAYMTSDGRSNWSYRSLAVDALSDLGRRLLPRAILINKMAVTWKSEVGDESR